MSNRIGGVLHLTKERIKVPSAGRCALTDELGAGI